MQTKFGRRTLEEMEEVVPASFREAYPGDSSLVGEEGVFISAALVEFSYTREGRSLIGVEFPNPVPVEAPIGHQPYEDIWVTIRRMVLSQAQAEASSGEEEFESEEEANDFHIEGDEIDPASPWEEVHEPVDPWPMSSAARQLEQRIMEERSKGRITILQQELEALQQGKEWPPKPEPSSTAEPASQSQSSPKGA